MKINLAVAAISLLVVAVGCKEKESQDTSLSTPPATEARPRPAVVDADNTGKNVRDRADATLTPEDQGESAADREITQKVRKAITSAPGDYSVTAKNIKVITANGKVTLRGPVKTEDEKTSIASLAKGIAGEANVDDQLEVKSNP